MNFSFDSDIGFGRLFINTDDLGKAGTYKLKLEVYFTNFGNEIGSYFERYFIVEVVDPCPTATLTISNFV